jgi:hypothetical protein
MKNLVVFTILGCAAVASANFLEHLQLQDLNANPLSLPYDQNIGCGGCLRSGYTFCRNRVDVRRRDPNDRCCRQGDLNCMWDSDVRLRENLCATTD